MSNSLIVVTGAYRVVGAAMSRDAETFGQIHYFASISDTLKQRAPEHYKSCAFFDDLLMHHEIDRDSKILSLLEKPDAMAVVEEWHIGNIAWARTRSPDIAHEYERKLHKLLARFESVDMRLWYVSTDLEKFSNAFRTPYQQYLGNLSSLTSRLDLPLEPLDGDAPSELVRRRIVCLLANTGDV